MTNLYCAYVLVRVYKANVCQIRVFVSGYKISGAIEADGNFRKHENNKQCMKGLQ